MKHTALAVSLTIVGLSSATVHAAVVGWGRPAQLPWSEAGIVYVHEGHGGSTQARGVINTVDVSQQKIIVSHDAIKSLGWPAMTMDFPVNQQIDLSAVKAGMKVDFTLVRDAKGSWSVDTLKPAK